MRFIGLAYIHGKRLPPVAKRTSAVRTSIHRPVVVATIDVDVDQHLRYREPNSNETSSPSETLLKDSPALLPQTLELSRKTDKQVI
ncbi:unnamed protein product [Protopolystoma xenopodis]|uniref:Uncharacterized protein n=1 Tax=Protopolystoma xenopodis TaxID=117903 RepID=A0A3S5AWM1_9PLAT|nr:unnamed protein product [Protopolystoma xenopodis]